MTASVRIGTRGSALAMAQTRTVADAVTKASGLEVELVSVTTHGDTSDEPISQLGGTGVFAGALRSALLAGECDLVVHSMKDLPTGSFPGLVVSAVPKRADARDALCVREKPGMRDKPGVRSASGVAALPEGARVGTGSPRRAAQLAGMRADLTVTDIRGNVDTRLGRVGLGQDRLGQDTGAEADLDAVVLAAAGLARLGRTDAVTEFFDLAAWPTAPGQGALAVEVREGDEQGGSPLARAMASVNHATTRATTLAERRVLARLEAGCAAPVGATASIDSGLFFLTATVYSADGTEHLTSSHAASLESRTARGLADAAGETAERVSDELLEAGAAELAPLGGGR